MDFKTPYYELDLNILKKEFTRLNDEFKKIYSNFNIAYSVKTNNHNAVLTLIKKLGGKLECVSDEEVDKSLYIPMEHEKIIFNGPCKNITTSYNLLINGGYVNVDSIEELKEIECYAEEMGNKDRLKVGVRLNIDVGNRFKSRFGISNIVDVEDFFIKSNHLKLIGIHCHISHAREIKYWEKRASEMIKIAKRLNIIKNTDIRYIDFGGNMYSEMIDDLKNQYGTDVANFKEYAETVAGAMKEAFPDETVELILEAGTPIVAQAMSLVSRVIRIKDGNSVLLDTSKFQLGYISQVKNLPIEITNMKIHSKKRKNFTFYGFTCIEDDVLGRYSNIAINEGDIVRFQNIGAYSYVQCPDFIKSRPKTKVIHEKN